MHYLVFMGVMVDVVDTADARDAREDDRVGAWAERELDADDIVFERRRAFLSSS